MILNVRDRNLLEQYIEAATRELKNQLRNNYLEMTLRTMVEDDPLQNITATVILRPTEILKKSGDPSTPMAAEPYEVKLHNPRLQDDEDMT